MWWLWIVIPIGILVNLFGIMVFIGMRLPREHIATRRARYAMPVETIFQTISDLANRPKWLSIVKKAERMPDQNGMAVWRETWGFGDTVDVEVGEIDPPRRLVTRIIHDGKRPFGGRWIHEVSEADSGGMLTITEDGWISNPFFRFMARYFFGHAATLEKFLKDLGKHFGQEVVIQP